MELRVKCFHAITFRSYMRAILKNLVCVFCCAGWITFVALVINSSPSEYGIGVNLKYFSLVVDILRHTFELGEFCPFRLLAQKNRLLYVRVIPNEFFLKKFSFLQKVLFFCSKRRERKRITYSLLQKKFFRSEQKHAFYQFYFVQGEKVSNSFGKHTLIFCFRSEQTHVFKTRS